MITYNNQNPPVSIEQIESDGMTVQNGVVFRNGVALCFFHEVEWGHGASGMLVARNPT